MGDYNSMLCLALLLSWTFSKWKCSNVFFRPILCSRIAVVGWLLFPLLLMRMRMVESVDSTSYSNQVELRQEAVLSVQKGPMSDGR